MNALSFRAKLALAMGALILILSGMIYVYFPKKLEREALALVGHKADTLAQLTAFTIHPSVYFENRAALDEALSGARQDKDVAYVVVVDPSGRRLAEYRAERATAAALQRTTPGGAPASGLYEVMTPIRDGERELARLYIGISLARLNREIFETRVAIGVFTLAMIVAGLSAVFLISNLLTRPLRLVTEKAESIAATGLDEPRHREAGDEVQRLSTAFDDMSVRVAERNASLQQSHEQLRDLSKRLLSVQEQERVRIAREVHDELGQALTALKIELQQLSRRDGVSEEPAKALSRSVDAIIERVRKIATDLRPTILDDLGIAAALEQQLRRLRESTGIHTTLTISEEPHFDMLSGSTIFRIVRECLANVVRHAGATEVEVALTVNSREVVLQVFDNGRGISREEVGSVRSLGLIGIRERAELLGGTVRIDGVPGQGTTVIVTLPLTQ